MTPSLKNRVIRYPFWVSVVFIVLLVLSVFVINPLIITFKAQGEQSDARRLLLQVYQSLYSYKTENGGFPDTAGKTTQLFEFQELKPYIKNSEQLKKINNTNLFVTSSEEQFKIILQKKLANRDNDIQVLNSKKQYCHKQDGVKHLTETC